MSQILTPFHPRSPLTRDDNPPAHAMLVDEKNISTTSDLHFSIKSKLSCLAAAIERGQYKVFRRLCINVKDFELGSQFQKDPAKAQDHLIRHLLGMRATGLGPQASLSPFRKVDSTSTNVSPPKTIAYYQQTESQCITKILSLHQENAPLEGRLPAMTKLAHALGNQGKFKAAERYGLSSFTSWFAKPSIVRIIWINCR